MSNKKHTSKLKSVVDKQVCEHKNFKNDGHTSDKRKQQRFKCRDCGTVFLKGTEPQKVKKKERKKQNALWLYVWRHYRQSHIAKWLKINPATLSKWLDKAAIVKSKQQKEPVPEIRKVTYNKPASISYKDISGRYGIFIDLDGGNDILFEREWK